MNIINELHKNWHYIIESSDNYSALKEAINYIRLLFQQYKTNYPEFTYREWEKFKVIAPLHTDIMEAIEHCLFIYSLVK